MGEAAIAMNGTRSLWYAMDVLHGPFPKGEAAIRKHDDNAIVYDDFLRKLK